jgi:squalene-hopene/tetraprenyl-beta-curcumene cyclase
MLSRTILLLLAAGGPSFGGDWNPRLAADYLDGRQKAWFAWPAAQRPGGPCMSCHTGLTYLLARPELDGALRESGPTLYETGLLDSVRNRLPKKTAQEYSPGRAEPSASQAVGVESVLSALLLASNDARRGGTLSAETEQAFDRMWPLQTAGGWNWFNLDLEPWEEPESAFYGASLAALAVGVAPSGYQSRPEIQSKVEDLKRYLTARQQTQPLHNRLTLLWASTKLRGLLSGVDSKAIVEETLRRQQADGGWTIESLGSWRAHANAPAAAGSNAYATALVAFILQRAGRPPDTALDWLRAHQDPAGYWDAASMNKRYEPDSMPLLFMRDAATSFAAMALLESAK